MATKKTATQDFSRAVGRRKTAAARVRIMPGSGSVTINGRTLPEFFPVLIWQQKVIAPLVAVGREKDFDVSVKVAGGGSSGQCEAVRHGIARALLEWNEELRPILKSSGFLTRDSRGRERKKPGRTRARRGHQWRKR